LDCAEGEFAARGTDVKLGIDQHGLGTCRLDGDNLSIACATVESTIHEGHGESIFDRDNPAMSLGVTSRTADSTAVFVRQPRRRSARVCRYPISP
jgi:hypothetical protein